MALTYGFYNSKNHDRTYDAEQVGQIFDGVINDGIYATFKDGLQVKADSNLSAQNKVIIKPGRAWFDHTWTYNDANYDLTLPAPETALSRYDAVVLDINRNSSSRKNSITYVKGTPASNPSKPSMSTGDEKHKRYPLCYVLRSPGKTRIDQSDITNARGTSACPFVTAVTETFTVDNLLQQWEAQFDQYIWQKQREWDTFQTDFERDMNTWKRNQEDSFDIWRRNQQRMIDLYRREREAEFFRWMETEENKYGDWLKHLEIAWTKWFGNVQYVLDGDVAGHLQMQIDWIRKFSSIYVVDKVLYVPMSGASVVGKKLIFAGDH